MSTQNRYHCVPSLRFHPSATSLARGCPTQRTIPLVLAHQPLRSSELAWQIILAYARRWQVEMAIRYHKSELAFESSRLFKWFSRHKLLLIAALAYACLLSLLEPALTHISAWLLRTFCHRTGKRSRNTPAPLYRLRIALSFLWLTDPPRFFSYL